MRSKAGIAAAAILVAGWGVALAVSWPGHLSFDSIVQLHDGRFGFYHSWHPPVMAWWLGVLDAIVPGTGLFILLDSLLLLAAMLVLLWIGPRVSWAAAGVALVCVLLPQFALYQAIVWKDVLFADASVAGFAALALAEARHGRARLAWTAAAFALFALAALTRQNGLIVLGAGAVTLAAIAGWKNALGFAAAALAIVFAVNATLARHSDHGEGPIAQLNVLRLYDLIGAVELEPSLPLDRLKQEAPELERLMRSDGVRLYTPERNDTLVGSKPLQQELADVEPEWLAAQWSDLVLHHPWLYLKVRARVFAQVLFTPDIEACRPVFTGIEGPAGEMEDLNMSPRRDARDLKLAAYAKAFMGTPALSHVFFALLALVVMVVSLRRRAPGDLSVAALQGAALVFTLSFFAISIACDYRYLYFLDLAALAGAFRLTCSR
ncbi:MAG TPA: hypothetical protein VG889_18980 [Rhizomicrobium sp.]|nr:hypothetical protein [Rhizomicrobium sp.]